MQQPTGLQITADAVYGNKKNKEGAVNSAPLACIMALTAVTLVALLLRPLIAEYHIVMFGQIPVFIGIKGFLLQFKRTGSKEFTEVEADKIKGNNLLTVARTSFAGAGVILAFMFCC